MNKIFIDENLSIVSTSLAKNYCVEDSRILHFFFASTIKGAQAFIQRPDNRKLGPYPLIYDESVAEEGYKHYKLTLNSLAFARQGDIQLTIRAFGDKEVFNLNFILQNNFAVQTNVEYNDSDIPVLVQSIKDSNDALSEGFVDLTEEVATKVTKEEGKGLSTNDFTDSYKNQLDNLDSNLNSNLDKKVDKELGKGLSTNDFTNEYKGILDGNLVNTINGRTGNVVIVKSDVGLDSVDNTADADKPVSTAQKSYVDSAVNTINAAIDAINNSQNLIDIVGTYDDLMATDVTDIKVGDKIQVIKDLYHSGASAIYKYTGSTITNKKWEYVGAFGDASYTKTETNSLLRDNLNEAKQYSQDRLNEAKSYTDAVVEQNHRVMEINYSDYYVEGKSNESVDIITRYFEDIELKSEGEIIKQVYLVSVKKEDASWEDFIVFWGSSNNVMYLVGNDSYYKVNLTDYTYTNLLTGVGASEVSADVYSKAESDSKYAATLTTAKEYTDGQIKVTNQKTADLKESLYGYILDSATQTFTELDSAEIPSTIQVGDTVYNASDNTRCQLVSIEGDTKKSSNLLPLLTIQSQTVDGVTITNNQDGSYTLNGTSTGATWVSLFFDKGIVLNGTYALNIFPSGTTTKNVSIRLSDKYGNALISATAYIPKVSKTSINGTIVKIEVPLSTNTVYDNFTVKPILVEGNTAATTFKPYVGLQSAYTEGISLSNKDKMETYNIALPKTELAGVGTAKDTISVGKEDSGYFVELTRKVATRDYQSGDESDSSVLTDNSITYYPLATPTTTRIASGLNYEQMTAICQNGGTISNLGNDNAEFVKPNVSIERVYKLTDGTSAASSTSESESDI